MAPNAGATGKPLRNGQPGETHWSQASDDAIQREAPKQFSEVDQSASSQAAGNDSMQVVGKQAFIDATTSMDTDRGPVMDKVYNQAVIEGHRVGDEEQQGQSRDPPKSTASRAP